MSARGEKRFSAANQGSCGLRALSAAQKSSALASRGRSARHSGSFSETSGSFASVKLRSQLSFDGKLYAITDRSISGLSHSEQVRRLCDGGATFIQIREKLLSPREFFREAENALGVARTRGARVIINDRVDIAFSLKADGVHLGQDDLPVRAARELLGDDVIIGISAHNLDQVTSAMKMPVDYIAIGPIFSTSTKAHSDPLVGLAGLSQIRKAVGSVPLVAIGGITMENAVSVISAGADAIAAIAVLLSAPSDITNRTQELLARL